MPATTPGSFHDSMVPAGFAEHTAIERAVKRRAVRLTPLGARLVERLRRELETGKRIRWDSLADAET